MFLEKQTLSAVHLTPSVCYFFYHGQVLPTLLGQVLWICSGSECGCVHRDRGCRGVSQFQQRSRQEKVKTLTDWKAQENPQLKREGLLSPAAANHLSRFLQFATLTECHSGPSAFCFSQTFLQRTLVQNPEV